MVSTIIYEVGIIICDIGIINMRFYLLEVRYGYCRIILKCRIRKDNWNGF
jgi:hypothetical protein